MNESALLAAGFRCSAVRVHDEHDGCYVRWINDQGSRRFLLVIRFWRHSKYSRPERIY